MPCPRPAPLTIQAKQACGFISIALIFCMGCGTPGAPLPPSLHLPQPADDLSAVRTDDQVRLAWTLPTRTTDRLPIRRPIGVRVCRTVGSEAASPCNAIASLTFSAGQQADFTDTLPAELAAGPPRLLCYHLELLNAAARSAGPGAIACSIAGSAPPPVTGLTAQVRREGVLLRWHPAAVSGTEPITYRINRDLLSKPPDQPSPQAKLSTRSLTRPVPLPAQQDLAVHSARGADPGQAIDASAQMNQQYRYTVERVMHLAVAGHPVELAGQPSDPLTVSTRDIFPPAVPQQLAAVADARPGAIDLSWSPDTESDLAGYIVYRRDLATTTPAQRIAPPPGAAPIPDPSFRDTTAERGHAYAYSVSAIDTSGNESPPSAEAQETLPSQP